MLDRALGNPHSLNLFPGINVSSSAICSSDHNPIIITLSSTFHPGGRCSKIFKYEISWGKKVEYKDLVLEAWNGQSISDKSMEVVAK